MKELITFQFATENRFFDFDSAAIRWRTDCEYSHVDIVMPSFQGETLLGARLRGGVQNRKPGYAPFSKTTRMTAMVEHDKLFEAYEWLDQQVGKPYDWRAIAGLALHRNWRNQDAWFCSELAFAFAEKCGVVNFAENLPDANINWLTPRDLILVLGAVNFANPQTRLISRLHEREEFKL